jgi:hypothetical protein
MAWLSILLKLKTPKSSLHAPRKWYHHILHISSTYTESNRRKHFQQNIDHVFIFQLNIILHIEQ